MSNPFDEANKLLNEAEINLQDANALLDKVQELSDEMRKILHPDNGILVMRFDTPN